MEINEPELKRIMEEFDNLILTLPDDQKSLTTLKDFITHFLKTKTKFIPLPVSEVMAILQQKKPQVFTLMKNTYSNNMMIHIITSVHMDYNQAYCQLDDIRKKLGLIKRY